ncbi:MAG: sensor histidine kinase [Nitriliruptoraceae bacterium]|nr:sensor histidine kinase [Nitriliruptoraceae bacterium]
MPSTQLWYLGFLGMLLFQPVFDPEAGALAWAITAIAILLFAPLYVSIQRHVGPLRRYAPWLTVALGVGLFWFNGGATVMLVYAAAFVGNDRPRPVAFRGCVGLAAVGIGMGGVAPIPWTFALLVFGIPIFFIWVVGIASIEEAEQWQEAQRLRVDNARIGHLATAAERERIARDLHDVLGQSLTEIIVRAQLARRLAGPDADATAREVAEIERASRTALDEVRAVVRGWREVRLDEELETVRRSLAAADIELELDRDASFDPAPTAETALALVLREAFTNIVRHAHAGRCTLRLHRELGQDVIEIADDGDGTIEREGAGLLGIRERVLALGGTFAYDDHDGVRLTVRVPAGVAT